MELLFIQHEQLGETLASYMHIVGGNECFEQGKYKSQPVETCICLVVFALSLNVTAKIKDANTHLTH